tara:strand:+ start:65456 stop:66727 length:1272 start_codon:yes stop_codon:yes gene_type:complete
MTFNSNFHHLDYKKPKQGGKSFLSSFFRKAFIKKFEKIKTGYIKINDREGSFSFGNSGDRLQIEVSIFSQDFYVMLGSGGVIGVAEAYMAGSWKASNLRTLLQIVLQNKEVLSEIDTGFAKIIKPINFMIHYRKKNTILGSKKNILAHYDVGNEFYKLWLDKTMTYSCAIFENSSSSLEDASIEKLDRLCRKLDLRKNDDILEIGTGWGSFAIHAAKNYGCSITTTTISDAQYNYVKELISAHSLGSKIKLVKEDYRNLKGKYDKIISIEMIEAVGHEFIPLFFSKVSSLLYPDGLVALQGITYNDQQFDIYKNSVDFIKKYIFPGSCLISIAQIANVIKKNTDLAIIDMEDITLHYAETLKRWRENFLSSTTEIKELGFPKHFIKMWEFYFAFCEAGFLERNIGDVQLIFAKSGSRNIKITY